MNKGVTDETRDGQGDIQMTAIKVEFSSLCNAFPVVASNPVGGNLFLWAKHISYE